MYDSRLWNDYASTGYIKEGCVSSEGLQLTTLSIIRSFSHICLWIVKNVHLSRAEGDIFSRK